MISHKNKFIFIQIPKTGCTSAQKILSRYGGIVKQGGPNRDFSTDPIDRNIYFKHITYSAIQESDDFKNLKDYFSFAFTRNPWDWLVSNYFYCKGIHSPYVKNRPPEKFTKPPKNINFEDWLYWYINGIKGTQIEMITDSSGEIAVDFVGKLENYQSDFNKVCDILKIDRIKLPIKNKTKHKSYKEYYNPDTIKLVAEEYSEDIDSFKYKF